MEGQETPCASILPGAPAEICGAPRLGHLKQQMTGGSETQRHHRLNQLGFWTPPPTGTVAWRLFLERTLASVSVNMMTGFQLWKKASNSDAWGGSRSGSFRSPEEKITCQLTGSTAALQTVLPPAGLMYASTINWKLGVLITKNVIEEREAIK